MPSKRRGKSTKKEHVAVRGVKVVHRHFWDHFIPHEGNDHVPHVLRHRVLLGYSIVILLLKVLAVSVPIMLPSASLYSSAITASNVIMLTNQTRLNLGLSALVQSSVLTVAAQAKAEDMLEKQYFSHYSPDGLSPWYFIKGEGYAYERAGENLAVHYTSAEGVHQGWLASPAHRANIVKEEFTEIGVGVVNGDFEGDPSTIVVQFFGKPKGAVTSKDENLNSETGKLNLEVESSEKDNQSTEPSRKENGGDKRFQQNPRESEDEGVAVAAIDLSNDTNSDKVSETVVQGERNEQLVDASRLVVKPTNREGVFEVTVKNTDAKSVAVQMGPDWVDLELSEDEGIWLGEVAGLDTYNKNGEPLNVITTDKDGKTQARTAVIAAPNLSVQDFFIFSEGKSKAIKLFGFLTIDNLDDGVKKFYVYFVLFMAAALMLKVLIKVHVQKVSVIAHAFFVMGFAIIMFLF